MNKLQNLAKKAKEKYKEIIRLSTQDSNNEIELPEIESKKEEKKYVHIQLIDVAKAVTITILLCTLALIIFEIKDILLLFFISIFIAAALNPTINKLEKHGFHRGVSTMLIFIIILGICIIFISNLIPILSSQLLDLGIRAQELVSNLANEGIKLPKYLEWLNPILQNTLGGIDSQSIVTNIQNYLLQFSEDLRNLAGNVFKTFIAVSNGIANGILVLMLTYFIAADEKLIDNFLISIFPAKYGAYITQKSISVKTKIGEWLRGQLILMFAIGILTYIGLEIIGVDYAFTLALFAGITELIPVVGPLLGWIVAIPIAANQSGSTLLWMTILYFVIQRLENNILVPIIMKKATGLHPLVVVFAMLVGYQFLGLVGVIISVPVAAVVAIFVKDYLIKTK